MINGLAQRRWLATIPAMLLTLLVLCPLAFAAQVSEVGDGFGYDSGTSVMTGHDGLSYQFRPDGTIKVMRGSETLSFVGLGVNGRIASGWITKYVTDFAWSWVHSVDAEGNHYFNASVVQTGFDWYVTVSFAANPALKMKVAYGFKNKLGEAVTNIRLFYLETIDNGATLNYNSKNYSVSWAETTHLTNDSINLTAVVPKIGFPGFWAFDYSDLVSDNFKITDFFAGNASKFDSKLPAQIVVVVAMTKGNGILPDGATEWADPTIQGNLVSASLSSESTRNLLAVNTSCGVVLHVVYANNSGGTNEIRRAMSLDEGNTWFNDSQIATDAEFPAIVNDSEGNVHIAYRKASAAWNLYYVNGSKNATCGWNYTVPASIGSGAGDDYGFGWGYDYDGNLWKVESKDGVTFENYTVRICPTASNCSVLASWVAPDGNALGYTPLYNPSLNRASGAPAVFARTVNEVLVFVDNGYNAMACRFNRVAANNYSPDTYDVRDCADLDGAGEGHYWPSGLSATVNSSGVVFAAFELNDGVKTGVAVTRCAANCHLNASWVALNGSQGYDNLFPNNDKRPVIGLFQDKPVVFFTNNGGTKDLVYSYVSGAAWGGFNNATNASYGSITEPAACYSNADGYNPPIYLGVVFPNATALFFLNFSDLIGSGGIGSYANQTSETYSAVAYETNSSVFNTTLDYYSAVLTFANASLVYNGSEYATNATDNGSTVYFNKTLALPFLSGSNANNTALVFYWSARFTYANASEYVWNSSARTQRLWFAWFVDAWTVAPTNLLAGQQALSTLNTSQVTGYSATVSAQIAWAGTNYSLTVDGFNFTRWNTAPAYSIVFGAVGWLNVTYGSLQRINMTTNTSVTVVSPSIAACNATTNQTIFNFTSRDEESNVSVNFSMDATFWLWNSGRTINTTYSVNWTNVFYAEACIYPNWAVGLIDSFQTYYSDNASQRGRFLYNVSASNESTLNYTLYLLNSSETSQVIVYVEDNIGQKIEGAIVKALRYFPGTNTYIDVAEVLTDFEGKGTTYLQVTDTYYRFVVEKDGVTRLVSSPTIIICTAGTCPPYSITLTLDPPTTPAYWLIFGNVASNCTFNNATNYLTCVTSDPSSQLASVNMVVLLHDSLNGTVVCNLSDSAFPAVQPCFLAANVTGNIYELNLLAFALDGTMISMDPAFWDFRLLVVNWGLMGYLLAFLLIATMFFIGIFNPSVAVVLAYIGVVASWMLGLLPMGPQGLTALIGLGIVAGIVVWRLRT